MSGTVKVRILVAVDSDGDWRARGGRAIHDQRTKESLGSGMARIRRFHWVEADIPLPEVEQTIAGSVSDGGTE